MERNNLIIAFLQENWILFIQFLKVFFRLRVEEKQVWIDIEKANYEIPRVEPYDWELARRLQEEEELTMKQIREDPTLFKCPHCRIPIYVKEGEMNCTIFICAVTSKGQMYQHNEKAAKDALAAGKLVVGCSKQFRFDSDTRKMVACTGR